jgi:hypothetical protein
MDGEAGAGEPEQIDHAEQMAREPGTRPICAALTADMRKALRTRKGRAAGLKARRLVCPGRGFALTPMGAQWREDLILIERYERALKTARDMLRDGAERQDVLEVVIGGLG